MPTRKAPERHAAAYRLHDGIIPLPGHPACKGAKSSDDDVFAELAEEVGETDYEDRQRGSSRREWPTAEIPRHGWQIICLSRRSATLQNDPRIDGQIDGHRESAEEELIVTSEALRVENGQNVLGDEITSVAGFTLLIAQLVLERRQRADPAGELD